MMLSKAFNIAGVRMPNWDKGNSPSINNGTHIALSVNKISVLFL